MGEPSPEQVTFRKDIRREAFPVSGDLEFAELPLLYRDGIHDDTPAIQAVLDGNPVRCAHCLVLMRELEHPLVDIFGRASQCRPARPGS